MAPRLPPYGLTEKTFTALRNIQTSCVPPSNVGPGNNSTEAVDQSPDAFDQLAKKQQTLFVEYLLSHGLTRRQRLVIVLRYWHDYSFEEIAARLNISRPSAYRLHQRALHKLESAALSRSVRKFSDIA